MPTFIECPSCRRKLRVPDGLMGTEVTCPTCAALFHAPAPALEPPVLEPAEPDPATMRVRERAPPRRPALAANVRPHRGTLLLVLGLVSIVACNFVGPFAWVLGNDDLEEIRAGRMDPQGESLTYVGKICGIIGSVLMIVQFVGGGIAMLAWLAYQYSGTTN